MTVPYNNNNYLAVAPGGAVILQATFETWINSGQLQPVTSPQLVIVPVTGGEPTLTTTNLTSGDEATWIYQWQTHDTITPGDYTATWTGIAPAGQLTITQNITVVALPQQSPTPGVYATTSQYQTWSGDTFTPVTAITIWLRRASETLDLALKGAVYNVDADGMPVDAATIDAFMRACCAQTEYMIANNDRANVKWQYTSTSMGGVSLARAPGTTGGSMPRLAPQAAAILNIAGVLPSAPLVNW